MEDLIALQEGQAERFKERVYQEARQKTMAKVQRLEREVSDLRRELEVISERERRANALLLESARKGEIDFGPELLGVGMPDVPLQMLSREGVSSASQSIEAHTPPQHQRFSQQSTVNLNCERTERTEHDEESKGVYLQFLERELTAEEQ